VFYYPQDVPPEMGPTELLPGSHFLYQREKHMAHYDAIKGSVLTAAPAGSIFLTSYNIWHRRGARTEPTSIRNLLKYNYWRTRTTRATGSRSRTSRSSSPTSWSTRCATRS